MANDTIVTRVVVIGYYDGHRLLHKQEHVLWSVERFTASLNAQAAKNRDKGEGFTNWKILP